MAAGIEPVRSRDLLSFIRIRTRTSSLQEDTTVEKRKKNAIATRFEGFER
jgi:hypothetical protein